MSPHWGSKVLLESIYYFFFFIPTIAQVIAMKSYLIIGVEPYLCLTCVKSV